MSRKRVHTLKMSSLPRAPFRPAPSFLMGGVPPKDDVYIYGPFALSSDVIGWLRQKVLPSGEIQVNGWPGGWIGDRFVMTESAYAAEIDTSKPVPDDNDEFGWLERIQRVAQARIIDGRVWYSDEAKDDLRRHLDSILYIGNSPGRDSELDARLDAYRAAIVALGEAGYSPTQMTATVIVSRLNRTGSESQLRADMSAVGGLKTFRAEVQKSRLSGR